MAIKERKQITGTEAQIKGYAGHNGVLAYATDTKHLHVLSGTAGTTTKLANMSDISGKADKTYVDTQLGTKVSTLIPKIGTRGRLQGYETTNTDIKAGTGIIVTADSPDAQYYQVDGLVEGDNVTVKNGTSGTSWTKVVYMLNGSIGLDTSWKWVGGKAPTLKYPGVLVVHWHHNGGIANYIAGVA